MFLLDTDVLSAMRKRQLDPKLRSWLNRAPPGDIHISAITVMEVERGIEQERRKDPSFALQLERWLQETLVTLDERVLPVDAAIAHRWGQLQARLGRKDFDVGIAATALEHKLRVVTGNVRHFETTGAVVINPFGAA